MIDVVHLSHASLIKNTFLHLLPYSPVSPKSSKGVQNGPKVRRACALRALGLLLADSGPTVGRGKTF